MDGTWQPPWRCRSIHMKIYQPYKRTYLLYVIKIKSILFYICFIVLKPVCGYPVYLSAILKFISSFRKLLPSNMYNSWIRSNAAGQYGAKNIRVVTVLDIITVQTHKQYINKAFMVTVMMSLESKLSTRIENNPLNYVSEVEFNVIIVTFPTDKVRMLLYK